MSQLAELSDLEKVELIEAEMLKGEQVLMPLKHHFIGGVYARELFIPKGTLLTGRIHLFDQINILSKGDISVLTDKGMVRVQAPFTIVSPPGTKRIAYAHEDCVWTTILRTNETDPEKIEQSCTVANRAEYLEFRKQIEAMSCPL